MGLELQKYEYLENEYLIYDCNKYHYAFGTREARVMCSQSVGLITKKILVGPIMKDDEMTLQLYNPDGTQAQPQTEDIKVFARYLADAGYQTTPRSNSGMSSDDDVHKVCRLSFCEGFIEKYNIKELKDCC